MTQMTENQTPEVQPKISIEGLPPIFLDLEKKLRSWAAQGKLKKPLIVAGAIAVAASLTAAVYFHQEYSKLKEDPQQQGAREVQRLVAQVSKLINLPDGEVPTVATVADPERLKSQAFFARAKKGDKILIYTQARRAYLYSPAENRLIDVAPLDLGGTTPTPPPIAPVKPTN